MGTWRRNRRCYCTLVDSWLGTSGASAPLYFQPFSSTIMKTKVIFIIGALAILGLFWKPLWRITLDAPQYPDGVNMYIYINKIGGDTPSTLQNINILNHYIGMKYIEPESIPELTYFPYIIAGMAALGLVFGLSGNKKLWFTWVAILAILGALGIYDYYLWLYDYGHNLDPNAAIKIEGMTYQPPLLGSKPLLNFVAHSYPHTGSIFLLASFVLCGLAIFMQKKSSDELPVATKEAPKQKEKELEPALT